MCVCPGNLFVFCVYSMQLLSSLIKELECWVSVSPSLSVTFSLLLVLAQSHRGILCDTNRHQTRHCTQTKTDRGRDVLFKYYARCLLSAASLAFQVGVNQPLCDPLV